MFGDLAISWYVVLFVGSIFGGFVGSLSGGAGMITMPLLLLSGLNPIQALQGIGLFGRQKTEVEFGLPVQEFLRLFMGR